MNLILIEGPQYPVITVAEAKQWLRVDNDVDESTSSFDDIIAGLIAAATSMFDGRDGTLGRCLMPQTWRLDLARFPAGVLELPLPPTIGVQEITYSDTDGITQTLAGYRVVEGGWGGAKVMPAVGAAWPNTVRDTLDAVRVTFRAGYGLDASPPIHHVPESIRHAMLLLISDWFDEGRNVVIGGSVASMPFAVDALVAPYRVNLLV